MYNNMKSYINIIHVENVDRIKASMAYINFTDGLALVDVLERIEAPIQVVRLRSNHLEQELWELFLWSVPDDMFYRLVVGAPIVFIDAGSRRSDCIPRTIWQGLPLIVHALLRFVWGLKIPIASRHLSKYIGKATAIAVDKQFSKIVNTLSNPLRNRIKYWRKYATPEPSFKITAIYGCGALTDEEAVELNMRLKNTIYAD